MPSVPSLAERVSELEEELALLRITVHSLENRLSEAEGFELVAPENSNNRASGAAHSTASTGRGSRSRGLVPEGAEREVLLERIARWIEAARGGNRCGVSGRDQLPGCSRYFLVVRDYSGGEILRVFSPWSEAERVVKQLGSFGRSLFIGLPRWADVEFICGFCNIDLTNGRRSNSA